MIIDPRTVDEMVENNPRLNSTTLCSDSVVVQSIGKLRYCSEDAAELRPKVQECLYLTHRFLHDPRLKKLKIYEFHEGKTYTMEQQMSLVRHHWHHFEQELKALLTFCEQMAKVAEGPRVACDEWGLPIDDHDE